MPNTCPPCSQKCRQGRECPATIAMRQKPVSLPPALRKLVDRLTNPAPRLAPFA